MAPARQQLMAAREKERFPNGVALYDGDEQEGELASPQSEDAHLEAGRRYRHRDDPRPARQSARLDRNVDGAA